MEIVITMLKKSSISISSKIDCILMRICQPMLMIIYKFYISIILFSGSHSLQTDLRADSMETEILQFVNDDRKQHDLSPLQLNESESSLALKHSQDMASGRVKFGHDGFNSRAKAIQKSLGATEVGENVASGP